MDKKILITGSHFTPAVAVIEQFKKYPYVKIVYVGRKNTQEGDSSKSPESQIIPKLGVKFIPIITGRLQRSLSIYTIPSLFKVPVGLIQALYIILTEKPDVTLSFGGYVAVPIVIASWLFSIPILIHEQTLVSGLANRISAVFADKVALSFKSNQINGKQIITGNPLRSIVKGNESKLGGYGEIFRLAGKEKLPVILITGGNQGSRIINKTVEECLNKLTKIACVIHVTGENKFKDFERLKGKEGERYLVRKWIGQEYGTILKKVDFVISRAGINTLTELAYIGKPVLVIPFPYLYGDEQNKNAKYFENVGLVKILPQSKLSGSSLVENIKLLLKNLHKLKQKAKNARKVLTGDGAQRLALETMLLLLGYEMEKR